MVISGHGRSPGRRQKVSFIWYPLIAYARSIWHGASKAERRSEHVQDPCDMHWQSPIGGPLFVPFILNTRELAVAEQFFVNLGLGFLASVVAAAFRVVYGWLCSDVMSNIRAQLDSRTTAPRRQAELPCDSHGRGPDFGEVINHHCRFWPDLS